MFSYITAHTLDETLHEYFQVNFAIYSIYNVWAVRFLRNNFLKEFVKPCQCRLNYKSVIIKIEYLPSFSKLFLNITDEYFLKREKNNYFLLMLTLTNAFVFVFLYLQESGKTKE